MKYKRWFRVLVCLVLVCALIVNISPIRAKALVAVPGDGILLLLLLIAAGVVFVPQAVEDVPKLATALSSSFGGYIGDHYTSEEQRQLEDELNFFFDFNGGGYFDDNGDPRDVPIKLSRLLLSAIAMWMATFIKNGAGAEVPADEISDSRFLTSLIGKWNGSSISITPSSGSFVAVRYVFTYDNGTCASQGLYLCSGTTSISWKEKYLNSVDTYKTSLDSNSGYYFLDRIGSTTSTSNGSLAPTTLKTWDSDVELPVLELGNFPDSASGSSAVRDYLVSYYDGTLTEIIEPDTYVGDIPEGIQNGILTADDIPLPEEVNFSSILNSSDTALEDIQNVAEKVANGDITYNDYVTMITVNNNTGGDTVPDETEAPVTEPEATVFPDTDDPDSSDSREIGDFSLDLTDFFPFCIPFDIFEFLSLLAAEPEAPVFEWAIQVPQLGKTFEVAVDLSPWNNVAALFRKLELLGFILGLAYVTREKYIRG